MKAFELVTRRGRLGLKILVLSQYWHPENGVPQRRWTWLTEVLLSAGHDVSVLAPPPHYKRSISLRQWVVSGGLSLKSEAERGPNGEVIFRSGYFPSGKSLSKRILNQAWSALSMVSAIIRPFGPLKTYRPDLIIGTVPALPTAAVAFVAAKKYAVPYVIDLRDAWPALFRESRSWNDGTGAPSLREKLLKHGPFQLLVLVTEKMIGEALSHASGIVTTSVDLALTASKQYGVPTATVRNVFPGPCFPREKREAQSNGQLNVLYAGTLGRAQKLENALVAAKLAGERGVDVALKFVGDGATWDALAKRAVELGIELSLEHQRTPAALEGFYRWADTALVHLTEWDSLETAVPSKTYELMTNGIHISGVVRGETARLIKELGAGDIVPPNDPSALAQLWIDLAQDRARLEVGSSGRRWVETQRVERAPMELLGLLEMAKEGL